MSLNVAYGNALSGLGATARMAEVVSANLANALTEGYGRRSVDLSTVSMGGRGAGVRVDGVARNVDRGLLADRRGAETTLSDRRTLASALRALEGSLGSSEAGTSLSARLEALETSLVSASADPSSETRLAQVLERVNGVAASLRDGAADIQSRRSDADASIASQVADLNGSLQKIAKLNGDIVTARTTGRDATGLMDQRQVLLDKVATLVPLREMDRPGGAIALITPQGATLLDGTQASTVGFRATPVITADMTLASGGLEGLTLNGKPVGADGIGRLAGGSLGAAFALRDVTLPAAATSLDALARDLITRFEDPSTDATLGGGAGLLTDDGAALDPSATTGLAGRIAVNSRVDPAAGGALWRLRDGVGAGTPGPASEAGQIDRWVRALTTERTLTSGGQSGSAAFHASRFLSDLGAQRLSAEQEESFAGARWSTLRESELSNSVDSDHEMQMLLQIEKAYAANARVISTIDAMMQAILEI